MLKVFPKGVITVKNAWDAVYERKLEPGFRNWKAKQKKLRPRAEAKARLESRRKREAAERAPIHIPVGKVKHG